MTRNGLFNGNLLMCFQKVTADVLTNGEKNLVIEKIYEKLLFVCHSKMLLYFCEIFWQYFDTLKSFVYIIYLNISRRIKIFIRPCINPVYADSILIKNNIFILRTDPDHSSHETQKFRNRMYK